MRTLTANNKRNSEASLIKYMIAIHPNVSLYREFEEQLRVDARTMVSLCLKEVSKGGDNSGLVRYIPYSIGQQERRREKLGGDCNRIDQIFSSKNNSEKNREESKSGVQLEKDRICKKSWEDLPEILCQKISLMKLSTNEWYVFIFLYFKQFFPGNRLWRRRGWAHFKRNWIGRNV